MGQIKGIDELASMRSQVYGEIDDFWPDLYQTEYALYDMYYMSQKEIEEIRKTTERAGRIFFKTAKLLRAASDATLRQLDLPEEILPFVRHRGLPVESVIARLDLVQTDEGYKVLEINSDTPTFEKEVFSVNGHMAKHFQAKNPNEGLDKELGKALRKAMIESALRLKKEAPSIVFTSHEDHKEDRGTTHYLMGLAGLQATYVPLHKLQILPKEGLYDDKGQRIDILCRPTYPLEHLILDQDPVTKELVGIQLLELVMLEKLALVNPISAFLLQSKAVQAVIWGLMEMDHSFYTEEEKQWIRRYFLPTYLEEDYFMNKGIRYVKKPCFGREGDTVEIFHGKRKLMEDSHKTYKDSAPVFQQYVELPTYEIQTLKGKKEAKLLIGSFFINGKASGIGIRAGNQITDNDAYFLPLGMK